ncbi:Imm49 family immunity protein [Niveibacterium sp. SC-1]|uniref:Imm49 family immunity protein n=1 Tax=Niveibacterium sp. SC-1 TaxID=3135646 RepID=UPI00311D2BCE
MILADYLEPLAYDIAFWTLGLVAPDADPQGVGALSNELGSKLRTVAIIVLLTKGDVDGYCHNLIRAARAREHYLQHMHAATRLDDHDFCAGRLAGFLSACAAEDFTSARNIAALSPGAYRAGHEYEDDFCYAQTLFNLIAPQRDEAVLAALCARWEACLKGAPGARLEVLRAIAGRDPLSFETAFEALLDERGKQIGKDIARGQLEEPPVVAERQVFIEGLALLRIAGRFGFPLQQEYRYCPSLALQPMQQAFPGE